METKHTPGPWAWFGNANSNSLYLATTHSGRQYVMGFKRWGFSGAQPQFQPEGRGLVDASTLLQFEVGDRDVVGVEAARQNTSVYRMDVRGIDCADARLIAAAPELLSALHNAAEFLRFYFECPEAESNRHVEGPKNIDAEASVALAVAIAAIRKATPPTIERSE